MNDDETTRVNEGRRVSLKALRHEQGNRRDLILVFLKTWQLTLKVDSDHTWAAASGQLSQQQQKTE